MADRLEANLSGHAPHAPPASVPSAWVAAHLPPAAPGATLLDVACGGGRHTRLAVALGYTVTAVDRDTSGVSDLAGQINIEIVTTNLEAGEPLPFAGKKFDVVLVTNYLWRPIFQVLVDAVAEDGLLIYETFAVGQEAYGRPKNPEFLLEPGELLRRIGPHRNSDGLRPVSFEQGLARSPDRVVQRIVAVGHKRIAPHPLPSIRRETTYVDTRRNN
ncbi:MAG: class I SAM-dependent methyltransferase [Hyphomicrobiaceae bacterium]|nr:class I SAM-dependent methyltransferase [Hyphomicrobiaceae bacterium]